MIKDLPFQTSSKRRCLGCGCKFWRVLYFCCGKVGLIRRRRKSRPRFIGVDHDFSQMPLDINNSLYYFVSNQLGRDAKTYDR